MGGRPAPASSGERPAVGPGRGRLGRPGLALDDFGSGWSSPAHLRDLPVHQRGTDRSFVTGLADRATDRTVVRTVTTLGHDLGLEVVAEGVETPVVRDLLVGLGVDLRQA